EYKLDKHWRGSRSGFMSFGLVQLGQAATSLGDGDIAYECIQHLVNRFWLNNLASMHNHRTLFNMDISGGMPAVLIKMLVASDPGKIKLLPALPSKWAKGSVEGVLCRGQVEVKSLQWDSGRIIVSLISGKDQQVLLQAPSTIRNISILKGNTRIEHGENEMSRNISLAGGEEIKLEIEL
ncbi:unnamed protein product, partial [marine sediment metagenome]